MAVILIVWLQSQLNWVHIQTSSPAWKNPTFSRSDLPSSSLFSAHQATLRTVEPRRVKSSPSTNLLRAPSVWTMRMSFLQSATRVTNETLAFPRTPFTPAQKRKIRLGWTKSFLMCSYTKALASSHKLPCSTWIKVLHFAVSVICLPLIFCKE